MMGWSMNGKSKYCLQILRGSIWLLKWLDYNKEMGETGFIWEKNMCHVLEVSGVLFRSHITNSNSDKFKVSSRNRGLSVVYERNQLFSHQSHLSLGLRIQFFVFRISGLYSKLLEYRGKRIRVKITIWIKYIFIVSLEKYEVNCNT